MKEKEPLVSSGDCGKDEDSAQVRQNLDLWGLRLTQCVCVLL